MKTAMKRLYKTTLTGLCLSCVGLPLWAASSWTGTVAPYQLRIDDQNITQLTPQKREWLPPLKSMGDEEMACETERNFKVQSWVGPVLSLQQNNYWNCVATAHPGAYTVYQTLNLKTGKTMSLTDIFSDRELLKALLADSIVKKYVPKNQAKFASSQALINYLSEKGTGECAYTFSEDSLSTFSLHHVKGNQVAVRIGLTHGCEAARGMLTELGLYLTIPAAWNTAFENARTGKAGFLMENNPVKNIEITQKTKDPHYEAALKAWMDGH
jgi:hypothetical protein